MNDATLQTDVENELRWDPRIHEQQIGVSAKKRADRQLHNYTLHGVVELDDHVANYYEKWRAERAALRG